MQSGPGYPPHRIDEPGVKTPVDVAFDILRWANLIETGQGSTSFKEAGIEGRDLRPTERAVYEASLEILRLYLTGEMTFDNDAECQEEADYPEKAQSCFFCSNQP